MKMELIVLAILVVFVGAFAYVSSTGNHEWSGSDDQPWAHSIWKPPSGEIESLLFALQAAFGSLIIGYFLGYYRAMAKMNAASPSKSKKET